MVIPHGVKTTKPNQVFKLPLIHNDFIQTNVDHTLFIKKNTSSLTILLVYEDNIIITGNSLEEFDKIKLN